MEDKVNGAIIDMTVEITGHMSIVDSIDASLSYSSGITGNITIPANIDVDPYQGEYTVVPSQVEQTLNTEGFLMTKNVTVAPIPKNYGLITWDGSVLTVS